MFGLAVNATIISIANNGRLARHIDSGGDLRAVANDSDRSGLFPPCGMDAKTREELRKKK